MAKIYVELNDLVSRILEVKDSGFQGIITAVLNTPSISLDKIAEQVDDKMTYMCGCRNCIEKVKMIIKGDVKPFENQCKYCHTHRDCPQKEEEQS